MDKKLEISLLYDFYGSLIPASQQQVVELYVNDDLSLSESADILGISRQGVRDSFNRACRKLRDFEQSLGLLKAYREREASARALRAAVGDVLSLTDDPEIHSRCGDIIALCDKMT